MLESHDRAAFLFVSYFCFHPALGARRFRCLFFFRHPKKSVADSAQLFLFFLGPFPLLLLSLRVIARLSSLQVALFVL